MWLRAATWGEGRVRISEGQAQAPKNLPSSPHPLTHSTSGTTAGLNTPTLIHRGKNVRMCVGHRTPGPYSSGMNQRFTIMIAPGAGRKARGPEIPRKPLRRVEGSHRRFDIGVGTNVCRAPQDGRHKDSQVDGMRYPHTGGADQFQTPTHAA